ncbi:MAG: hypothetical protein ACXAC0_08485 [Candidatus Thorarchaeota archaeon]|jgi:hypothetical protein|nr:MAG: hypothetical protein ThorAB25_23800 [Candidatus Thorarchaeota archaeon AB_25]
MVQMKHMLEYKNSQFHECAGTPTTPITLTVDESVKKLILVVPSGASMIERRAAERNARGIEKVGFQTNSKGRIGRGFELVIEGHGGGLPDRLRHSPREVY